MKKLFTAAAIALLVGVSAVGLANAQFIGAVTNALGIVYINSGSGAVMRTVYAWIADQPIDVKDFGAKGDGVSDDGPAFRAAMAICTGSAYRRIYVPTPATSYNIASLDGGGRAALVFGDGSSQFSCALEGEAVNTTGDHHSGVAIKLGTSLNRPLILVRSGAGSPVFSNLRLNGNRTEQSAYTGDANCNSKLYTVCVEDGVASPEGSITFNNSYVVGGFNGNLYVGSSRGQTYLNNFWSQYSGQSTSDYSVYLNGYDAAFNNIQIGPNDGNGIAIAQGAQFQIVNGAIFLNAGDGMFVNGGAVLHLSVSNVAFQFNGCNGINDSATTTPAGKQASGHLLSNITFDGNSNTTTNTCSDVKVANSLVSLANVAFNGRTATPGNMPKYNVEITSGNVQTSNIRLATTAYVTAFTNSMASIIGPVPVALTWTPVLAGDSVAGTPTYTTRDGWLTRNGRVITVGFRIVWSALGSPSGNMVIKGLPVFSDGTSGRYGSCYISKMNGWTASASATQVTAVLANSAVQAYLSEIKSGAATALIQSTELGSSGEIIGVCTYPTAS